MFLLLLCCNKASNWIVLTSKGFSVFFWITLSHEVSRLFPTHTHTHINTCELREPSTYLLYTDRLADVPLHWWRIQCPVEGGRKKKPGSSVADCIHTAIFKNICEIRAPYHANQIQGDVPHVSDLRSASTTKEIDK